jgi:hypothetical protein
MGMELNDLLSEIRATREALASGDTARDQILKQVKADVDRLALKLNRPGQDTLTDDALERKASGDYLALRHVLKAGPQPQPIDFGAQDLDSAAIARKAFGNYVRSGDLSRLVEIERKSLTEFTLGGMGVLIPPEISGRILSCLTDPNGRCADAAIFVLPISQPTAACRAGSTAIKSMTTATKNSGLIRSARFSACKFSITASRRIGIW